MSGPQIAIRQRSTLALARRGTPPSSNGEARRPSVSAKAPTRALRVQIAPAPIEEPSSPLMCLFPFARYDGERQTERAFKCGTLGPMSGAA